MRRAAEHGAGDALEVALHSERLEGIGGADDRDAALFKGLAHGFEYGAVNLGQFVEETVENCPRIQDSGAPSG